MRLRFSGVFLALSIFFTACTGTIRRPVPEKPNETTAVKPSSPSDQILVAKFNEIWANVARLNIVGIEDTEEAKLECALKTLSGGLSKCLDDPASEYFTREGWQDYEMHLRGGYSGVGLDLTTYKNRVAIIEAVPGTPAGDSNAFVAGDTIEKVDGKDVSAENQEAIINKITGPEGSKVTIEVRREGEIGPRVTLTRSIIIPQIVESAAISKDIQYIKSNHFTPRFFEEFSGAFSSAIADKNGIITPGKPRKSVVLDLRDNLGGYLIAVKLESYYFTLKPADIVVTLQKKDSVEQTVARDIIKRIQKINPTLGVSPGAFASTKMVVLVNQDTASASEIFAALLRDWLKVPIVGTRTYGKGSVQGVYSLGDDDGMKLTEAEYFVGNGHIKVNKTGLLPDYLVENPPEKIRDPALGKPPLVDLENDLQLKKAIEVLQSQ